MPTTVTEKIKSQPKTNARPNFWVVCCEENEATQQISQAVADWQLPEVKSLVSDQLQPAIADAVAPADYAIFITSCPHPSQTIKVNPLCSTGTRPCEEDSGIQDLNPLAPPSKKHPAQVLNDAQLRHGRAPQSWWFQLPTTERCANREKPVNTEKSVAQALNQIQVFVRNYVPPQAPTAREQSREQSPQDIATPPSAKADTPASSETPSSPAPEKAPAQKAEKRKVVLTHYRRI